MKDDLTWLDHLNHAAGFSSLVTVAAAKVADDKTRLALLTTAQVIGQHIEKASARSRPSS
ncbi:hypothetical protein G5V57_01995 [Nordella sp. HKS 07]|uniref:hypothetical protein n=1 Tax=Nordella sp. HKS 07 TaxID=2712222 RepID=UPI0013E143E8|nr:hypothetical protein [Nordella sp. HKS 07]QIG46635.1 hypothetical protein G5V57_01995 [Nordella sp. HKS 07]